MYRSSNTILGRLETPQSNLPYRMESAASSNSLCQPVLPPGFRFHPTDEELLVHYLKKKASASPLPVPIIAEIDLYKFDPWDLPAKSTFGEREWYFFSPRDRKYPNGARPNRAAASGYWKATGTDKPIFTCSGTQKLGVKKALVFYKGRPPKGVKTNWVMHEYRLAESPNSNRFNMRKSLRLDDWVLCRIYRKNLNCNKLNSGSEEIRDGHSCDSERVITTLPDMESSKTSFLPRLFPFEETVLQDVEADPFLSSCYAEVTAKRSSAATTEGCETTPQVDPSVSISWNSARSDNPRSDDNHPGSNFMSSRNVLASAASDHLSIVPKLEVTDEMIHCGSGGALKPNPLFCKDVNITSSDESFRTNLSRTNPLLIGLWNLVTHTRCAAEEHRSELAASRINNDSSREWNDSGHLNTSNGKLKWPFTGLDTRSSFIYENLGHIE